MAALVVQEIDADGMTPALVAAAGGGDTFVPGSRTFLEVVNASVGSITVTVNDPTSDAPEGAAQFNPDIAVAVAAGTRRFIGPFPAARFANASGVAEITYSGVTTLTIGAFSIGDG